MGEGSKIKYVMNKEVARAGKSVAFQGLEQKPVCKH